jgi:hypothetical protein
MRRSARLGDHAKTGAMQPVEGASPYWASPATSAHRCLSGRRSRSASAPEVTGMGVFAYPPEKVHLEIDWFQA